MVELKGRNWSKQTVTGIMHRMKQIRRAHGLLTPELIVEDARDPNSPLHRHFEWNDTLAAEKWRLHQARELVCKLKINLGTEETPRFIRALVNVIEEEQSQYKPVTEIRRSPELTAQVLERALADYKTLLNRYEIYEAFFKTNELTRKAIAELTVLLESLSKKKRAG